jgi:hypothetical protein
LFGGSLTNQQDSNLQITIMSLGSSGRYQSRLLKFVHLQSRRLTQQWDHTFRHLQVATQWGVELLLYPIYLLLNPRSSVPKILKSQAPQPETFPTADTPIENVLEAVKSLSSQPKSAPLTFWGFVSSKVLRHPPTQPTPAQWTTSQNPRANIEGYLPKVRGVATNLVSGHVVLVTTDNEILDILTPEQQAKLEARIISEVGNYWHYWQLNANKPQSKLLGKINDIFAKITGRIAVNVPALPASTPTNLVQIDKLIAFLDTSIAHWENNALLPVQQRSHEIIRLAQVQLNIFIYGKEQVGARGDITVNTDGLKTHQINIPALIEAAINYFFGVRKYKKIPEKNSQIKSPIPLEVLPQSRQLQNEDLTKDTWLNWSDLFGDAHSFADQSITSQNSVKSNPKATSNWLQNSQSSRHVTLTPKNAVNVSENLNLQAITENPLHSQVESQPEWIEVKATFIGYDKDALEQVLEWLDRAILWLEEIIVKVFQFLQRLWSGK